MFHNPYMQRALELAELAAGEGEVPIAAIITERASGRIIVEARNAMHHGTDPTAHAEVLAIRAACHKLGTSRLVGYDMYVTLEPCPMCAQAISFARLDRLYYAATDIKGGGVETGARIFHQPTCFHKPEIYGGIHERESATLLQRFFEERR